MKPETIFAAKVKGDLLGIPGVWAFKSNERAVRGIPDIICCIKGKFVALELKIPPNKVKPKSLQAQILRQIQWAGGIAREVTPSNWGDILEELNRLTWEDNHVMD